MDIKELSQYFFPKKSVRYYPGFDSISNTIFRKTSCDFLERKICCPISLQLLFKTKYQDSCRIITCRAKRHAKCSQPLDSLQNHEAGENSQPQWPFTGSTSLSEVREVLRAIVTRIIRSVSNAAGRAPSTEIALLLSKIMKIAADEEEPPQYNGYC